MSYQKNLTIQYHQQDTDYYCGAACAQMVLESIGSGLLGQAGLYNDNHGHGNLETDPTMNWATPPDGLEWTLDHRSPAAFQMRFVTYAPTSEDNISRKIAWTIEHYDVAPCALVQGSAHWIVVRGMKLSRAPNNSGDTGYTFDHFRVNNPWPPVPSSTYWANPAQPPPPPHNAGDGCGAGGNRGIADEVINYNQWQNTYMTGVGRGYWQGKFVAVCDPDPPPTMPGRATRYRRRFKGERLITTGRVKRLAAESIDRLKLPLDRVWQTALRDVDIGTPVLVQRLDRLDDYYYVVPLLRRGEVATGAVAIDARFGDFQQASILPTVKGPFVTYPSRRAVLELVSGKEFRLENFEGYLRVRPEAVTIPEIWFWRPCLESLSPLWPFKMVISGGQTLYVRVDGAVFSALHEDVHGI